jgi:hypothetical protein
VGFDEFEQRIGLECRKKVSTSLIFYQESNYKFEYDFEFVEDYVLGLIDELIEMFWINCYR